MQSRMYCWDYFISGYNRCLIVKRASIYVEDEVLFVRGVPYIIMNVNELDFISALSKACSHSKRRPPQCMPLLRSSQTRYNWSPCMSFHINQPPLC